MNDLSWFIYFASAVDGARAVTGVVAVFGGIVYGVFSLMTLYCAHSCDPERSGYGDASTEADLKSRGDKSRELAWALLRRLNLNLLPVVLVCCAVIVFVPSRSDMILIAGSQMGERIAKSEAVQGVVDPGMNLIKLWIKQETEKLKKTAE